MSHLQNCTQSPPELNTSSAVPKIHRWRDCRLFEGKVCT